MTINLLAFGIFAYFLGLFFSGLFSLLEGHWKKSVQLFVISNLIGFITGVLFLLNFPSRQLILTNLDWFFLFSPSLDLLSAIFFVLISGVSALVGIYSFRYLEIYKETYNPRITQFLTVLFVFGMQGVLFANNTFSFLFLWEVMSIASFFLVFADRKEQSLKAAFLYFVMTHLGASAILAGFLILGNGSLLFDLSDISTASQGLSFGLKILAFFLFFFGFGSKAGLVPFHIWLPEAHPAAPSNVSALMSGLMLKVAVYGFIRVAFSFTDLPEWVGLTVISFGLLSAFSGALRAVIERDIKKVFAYSSIENMGIIFSMLGTALYISVQSDQLGILAISNIIFAFAILHIASHSFFKTGLFLSSGVIMSRFHSKSLEKMGGLAKIMPVFSFAFLLVILGSLPLPPFGTFYGEWGFIQNIISLMSDLVLKTDVLAVLILIVSILGLVSGLAFFAMTTVFGLSMLGLPRCKELESEDEGRDVLLVFPIMALAFGVLFLGIFAKNIVSFLNVYANFLTGNIVGESYAIESKLSSMMVFVMLIVVLSIVYLLYGYFAKRGNERKYRTWDCGQAIDETMQYSATAFSAPIRFFFLHFIKREKKLKAEAIVETNPWICKYSFLLSFDSIWKDNLYRPIVSILKFIADKIKIIQGGRIQYYLMFVLGTLIVALIIFL